MRFSSGHVRDRDGSFGPGVLGQLPTACPRAFFAILKRGIYGTFHSVSKEHLHRYLAEFEYRYNTRGMEDGERTALAIQRGDGKRLRYREPVNRTAP